VKNSQQLARYSRVMPNDILLKLESMIELSINVKSILRNVIMSINYWRVTDRQTDRRSDGFVVDIAEL